MPTEETISRTSPSFMNWIVDQFEPGILLLWSVWVHLKTTLKTIFQRREPLSLFTNFSKFRNEAFGAFWLELSAARDRELELSSNPSSLLIGSSALIPDLLEHMSGTVLDIGPGSGSQLPLMKRLIKGSKGMAAGRVKKIYGAEPCTFLHKQLQANIDSLGLSDEYTIVNAPAEKAVLLPALRDLGVFGAGATATGGAGDVMEGISAAKATISRRRTRASTAAAAAAAEAEGERIFDSIVCIRVLCSVPDPEKTIADLYSMLKPGGKMIILEHVKNPGGFGTPGGSLVARTMQILYHALGWSFFVGDCHMDRDTQLSLLKAPVLARALRRDLQSHNSKITGSKEVEDEEEGEEGEGGGDSWEEVDLTVDFDWGPLPYLSGVLVKRK